MTHNDELARSTRAANRQDDRRLAGIKSPRVNEILRDDHGYTGDDHSRHGLGRTGQQAYLRASPTERAPRTRDRLLPSPRDAGRLGQDGDLGRRSQAKSVASRPLHAASLLKHGNRPTFLPA